MRTDSRPIKTKKSIKQALLILLKEKDMKLFEFIDSVINYE